MKIFISLLSPFEVILLLIYYQGHILKIANNDNHNYEV